MSTVRGGRHRLFHRLEDAANFEKNLKLNICDEYAQPVWLGENWSWAYDKCELVGVKYKLTMVKQWSYVVTWGRSPASTTRDNEEPQNDATERYAGWNNRWWFLRVASCYKLDRSRQRPRQKAEPKRKPNRRVRQLRPWSNWFIQLFLHVENMWMSSKIKSARLMDGFSHLLSPFFELLRVRELRLAVAKVF